MGRGQGVDDCAICLERKGAGDTLIVLACNTKHSFHERCYDNFININNGNNYCPLCRALIDRNAITKKKLEAATSMTAAEAFDIGASDQKGLAKNVDDLNENDFVKDAPPATTEANLMNPQIDPNQVNFQQPGGNGLMNPSVAD